MSQFYLNGPSVGRAMSAEEFAAGAGLCPGAQTIPSQTAECGCGEMDCGCPDDGCRYERECCCRQMICCCHPAPEPPRPPQVDEDCCCKESFRAALGLLCDQQISSLLDFNAAAFITNTYSAGAALNCGKHPGQSPCTEAAEAGGRRCSSGSSCSGGASDNLGTLSGSFRRFTPCNRDLLDIEADLHTAGRMDCGFTATQVSVCELDAVVIQGARACAEGEMTADEVTARNFRRLRRQLAQQLNPNNVCGQDPCPCNCAGDDRECCCAAGLLDTLARNNISRRVSLAAGLLQLRDVTLLGTVGSVLVLSNDADERLYFVCVNSVQFIG